MDVIESFLAYGFLTGYCVLQHASVESADVYPIVEVLDDLLEEQVLGFFSVFDVTLALDSQIDSRQAFFLPLLVYFHIKEPDPLEARNFGAPEAVQVLCHELLLGRELDLFRKCRPDFGRLRIRCVV